jgi:hypothetical protein
VCLGSTVVVACATGAMITASSHDHIRQFRDVSADLASADL